MTYDLKVFTKEELIQELKRITELGWVKNNRKGNVGGIGNTLEDLLGIAENNLPIPNATEWELKTQRLNTSSLTTLFHIEPSPRALKFVPEVLLPSYGWLHKDADRKYPANEMSFRQTISGLTPSDRGFMVKVDRAGKRVVISFDHTKVSTKHSTWFEKVRDTVGLAELDPQPYWGFNDLEHKAGTKLLNCFYVQAETKLIDKEEYYRYSRISMLQKFDFYAFLQQIESGNIYVDFDARTGHNHGTKFRLKQNCFPFLYASHEIIYDRG